MPLTSFITPPGRRQISDTLEEVFQRPAVCEIRLSAERAAGKPQMDARMLMLPLKSDLGDVSRILGCLVARGDIGRSPRRFDVIGTKMRPIVTPAAMPQPDLVEAQKVKQPAGFAEASNSFKPATEKTNVPYLRIVKSED